MLPTKTDAVKTGDIGGENVKMAFDEGSLEFLAGILTDLYSDQELACIREYSTNALDSHIAAGQTRPIEVTTPGPFSPFFKVRDWGVGLSADDIRNIYSKFGASTKRQTNDQTGMLGLGCKSALTYTNQFNIAAVKDGVRILVLVSRDETGGGSMSIVSETETDEPNGVEISIPVKGRNSFVDKAKEFFKFWEPGTVLVDGKEPDRPTLLKLDDDLFVDIENQLYGRKSYVVMGNVPYPIDANAAGLPYSDGEIGFVAYVKMGDVNFTPSREALHYTVATKVTIKNIVKRYYALINPAVTETVNKVETHAEAIQLVNKLLRSHLKGISGSLIKYRGKDIPAIFPFKHWYQVGGGDHGYRKDGEIHVDYRKLVDGSGIIVTGFDKEKVSSHHKAKMRKWAENKSVYYSMNFFVADKMPGLPWLANLETVDWAEINKIKLGKPKDNTPKPKATYEVWLDGAAAYVQDLDTSKPILYAWVQDVKSQARSYGLGFKDISLLLPGTQVVSLAANRVDAFKRKYPTAENHIDEVQRVVKAFFDGMTKEQKIIMTIDYYDRNVCNILPKDQIEDPDVVDMIEAVENDSAAATKFSNKYTKMLTWANCYRVQYEGHSRVSVINKRYPLAYNVQEGRVEHAVLYINHIYNVMYKENND